MFTESKKTNKLEIINSRIIPYHIRKRKFNNGDVKYHMSRFELISVNYISLSNVLLIKN
jgi:hypothetical protein